ncbi:type II toxin-antitoxin system VapC family toxin [Lyngbya confervoides]|uniref:PIN domain-containing protein n=1 Tax=Lyngbya confervoides BDU141951 TaxID=1574623 RepID=A0ABD4T002_9CYAN|nr:PIN domain-containing protein [Lyngbya confervoides]MCM1981991.1 PIN domain-containing protein [Lyngbya confervoides BDU141951]
MTLDDSPIFLDTNILVYANVTSAPLHPQALETLQQLQTSHAEIWISRQILREFIATLTRPQLFLISQPMHLIAERIHYFEHTFSIAEDNSQVTQTLLQILQDTPSGGKQIHDANIVATMLTVGVSRLLSHNVKDFARFSHLITVVPLADQP